MKKIIFALSLLFHSLALNSSEVSIAHRLEAREDFRAIYPVIYENKKISWTPDFRKSLEGLDDKSKAIALEFIKTLDPVVPSIILRALTHYRFIQRDDKKFSQTLSYYMRYKLYILRDYLDSPESKYKSEATELLLELYDFPINNSSELLQKAAEDIAIKSKMITELDERYLSRAISEVRIIADNFKTQIPDISDYLLSYYGIVPGNKVKLISQNQTELERIKWVNDHSIFAGATPDWSAPYIKMPMSESDTGNPIFKDPIFAQIRDLISESKESIFVDIFLFGGTMGMTLAKYLVDQTLIKKQQNPKFKTLLLHDYATNYNMKDEMMPIFEYLKGRIDSEKAVRDSFILLQANIHRHPPGIPLGLTNLIPKTPEVFAEIEKRNTYFESKIDHSKVIVIDASSDNPKAYFGSKNWSDHSGAYYYDNALLVEGPAAAMVQASYYHDVEAALTTNKKELDWFYYKEAGFDNKRYLADRSGILDWFKVKRASYPARGEDSVRIAEADVDGMVKNVRSILVDMIMKAQSHIYMEQLFIYDPYIVDALIKKKISMPELDVRILADHNGNFKLGGLPNTLFINELQKYSIKIRARKTKGVLARFPDGSEREYHQENHRKITSVDGEVLLVGSSNLNPDTLQGSFREFGAKVFAKSEVEKFEGEFLSAWRDTDQTAILNIHDFQVELGAEKLSKELSALINSIGSMFFRNKDSLEERHK